MRRKAGIGLVRNELRLLLTAVDLLSEGREQFHGYDLARHLAHADDGASIMSQPTLYRSLRRLEERGALSSRWESLDEASTAGREGRPRRYYAITSAGTALAASELRDSSLSWSEGKLIPFPSPGSTSA